MDRQKKFTRLVSLWLLIANNPLRYSTKDLAKRFGFATRTIYRDISCLESDLKVPVYDDKGKWAIDKSYYLPPVSFSTPEAITMYLAVRLMLSYSHHYDPHIDSLFTKLSSVVQPPLREQIEKTLTWMQHFPKSERYLGNLAKLAEAWLNHRRIKMNYRSLEAETASERLIDPYFIEPAAAGHASYVIAFCHRTGQIRSFKIERIERIEVTAETYTIPPDFDANQYFAGAWTVVVEGETKTIRLRFAPGVSRIIEETVWHPSQLMQKQKDGSVIMTLQVMDTVDLFSWILGWGERVEVLEPEEIRKEVLQTAKAMAGVYKGE